MIKHLKAVLYFIDCDDVCCFNGTVCLNMCGENIFMHLWK